MSNDKPEVDAGGWYARFRAEARDIYKRALDATGWEEARERAIAEAWKKHREAIAAAMEERTTVEASSEK